MLSGKPQPRAPVPGSWLSTRRTRPRTLGRWGRCPAAGFFRLGAAVLGMAGVGALVQAWATRRDERRYPPPGALVDVGGNRLHLDVRGDGPGPTVVLEAGMGSFSPNWYWVQSELAPALRVVAYDRAGLGWSERGTAPRDADTLAVELHTALQAAGVARALRVGRSLVRWAAGSGLRPAVPRRDGGPGPGGRLEPGPVGALAGAERGPDDRHLQRVTAALARVGLLRLVDLSRAISAGLPDRPAAELGLAARSRGRRPWRPSRWPPGRPAAPSWCPTSARSPSSSWA